MNRIRSLLLLISLLIPMLTVSAEIEQNGINDEILNNQAGNQDSILVKQKDKSVSIKEVILEGDRNERISKTFTGRDYLNENDINNVPSFMGEADVLRAVKLQTGIQSVSEGNSGIYVRGGSSGQNLFLFDEMEIMNPSHMMGLYSVFNPLTTGSVVVYKGNAPVNLNGRLSSAICVYSKIADIKDQGLELNIGNISSTMSLKLVSPDEKWSLTTGYRRSYLEALGWAASLFLPERKNYFNEYGYKFYDFNGKIQGKLSDKSTLMLAWYSGYDWFSINNKEMGYDATTEGGNKSAVIQYKYNPNNNNFFSHSLNYTSVATEFDGDVMGILVNLRSDFQQLVQKNQWTIKKDDNLTDIGLDFFFHRTMPMDGKAMVLSDTLKRFSDFRNAGVTAYAGETWSSPNGKMVLYGGLRATLNASLGPYDYLENHVGKNEIAKLWFTLVPVVSVSLYPKNGHSYKASFSVNEQNLHLASLTSIPLPNDMWMSSSPRIRPEISNQLTFGYYRELENYGFYVEAWGKYLKNQLICNFVTDFSMLNGFEDQFLNGKGYAYGLEFSLKKKIGKVKGNLNYTYSRSRRSYEKIFNGDWFNDKYDRPHDLNLGVSYLHNKRWDFSALWVLASGINTTLPSGRWWLMGSVLNDYEGFNKFRLPLYHRLDLSANLKLKPKHLKESELNFSIINVYNRANPYFIYLKVFTGENQYTLDIKTFQVSLFPVMPSVSWRIKI